MDGRSFPRSPEPSTSLCSLRVEERGRGVGERGFCSPRYRQEQSVSCACGARVTSPLLVHAAAGAAANSEAGPKGGGQDARSQGEVTKRKRHPDGAPSGHPALRVRGRVTGFSTAHPCAGGKLARIHASHPADFPPPTRRAIGAPGKAARSRRALGRSRVVAAEAAQSCRGELHSDPCFPHLGFGAQAPEAHSSGNEKPNAGSPDWNGDPTYQNRETEDQSGKLHCGDQAKDECCDFVEGESRHA